MVSALKEEYLQIIPWEYSGPRMEDNDIFFEVDITPKPTPFALCYAEDTHINRVDAQYMLVLNGFIGANWNYLSRKSSVYTNIETMHIYDPQE